MLWMLMNTLYLLYPNIVEFLFGCFKHGKHLNSLLI